MGGGSGPECHTEERYEYLAANLGLTVYSIIDLSRVPIILTRACRMQWQYVPGGIYVPC